MLDMEKESSSNCQKERTITLTLMQLGLKKIKEEKQPKKYNDRHML